MFTILIPDINLLTNPMNAVTDPSKGISRKQSHRYLDSVISITNPTIQIEAKKKKKQNAQCNNNTFNTTPLFPLPHANHVPHYPYPNPVPLLPHSHSQLQTPLFLFRPLAVTATAGGRRLRQRRHLPRDRPATARGRDSSGEVRPDARRRKGRQPGHVLRQAQLPNLLRRTGRR